MFRKCRLIHVKDSVVAITLERATSVHLEFSQDFHKKRLVQQRSTQIINRIPKKQGADAQGTQGLSKNSTCREIVSPLSRLTRGFVISIIIPLGRTNASGIEILG